MFDWLRIRLKVRQIKKLPKERIEKAKEIVSNLKRKPLNEETIEKELLSSILLTGIRAEKLNEIRKNWNHIDFTLLPEIRKSLKPCRRYKTKSKYIFYSYKKLKEFPYLIDLVQKLPPSLTREIIVNQFDGIGYKNASFFLRNIGKGEDLAILDSKIRRWLGKLDKGDYLKTEQIFKKIAKKVHLKPAVLDALIWSLDRPIEKINQIDVFGGR